MLSADVSLKATICKLQERRVYPGLAYYHNTIYLFGGHKTLGLSSSAECVDLDTRLLAYTMPMPLFKCIPCRHGDYLYFGSFLHSNRSFVFHLLSENVEKSGITYEMSGYGIALALPDDEIIVLAMRGIYSYPCQAKEVFRLAEAGKISYVSGSMALLRKCGSSVFAMMGEKQVAQVGEVQEAQNPLFRQLDEQLKSLLSLH